MSAGRPRAVPARLTGSTARRCSQAPGKTPKQTSTRAAAPALWRCFHVTRAAIESSHLRGRTGGGCPPQGPQTPVVFSVPVQEAGSHLRTVVLKGTCVAGTEIPRARNVGQAACQLRPRSPAGLWPLNFVLHLLPGHVHLSQRTEAQEQPQGWPAGQPEGSSPFPPRPPAGSSGQGSLRGRGRQGREGQSLPDTRSHELTLQAKTRCSKGSLGPRTTDGVWAALRPWAALQGWRPRRAGASPVGPRQESSKQTGREAGLRCLVARGCAHTRTGKRRVGVVAPSLVQAVAAWARALGTAPHPLALSAGSLDPRGRY